MHQSAFAALAYPLTVKELFAMRRLAPVRAYLFEVFASTCDTALVHLAFPGENVPETSGEITAYPSCFSGIQQGGKSRFFSAARPLRSVLCGRACFLPPLPDCSLHLTVACQALKAISGKPAWAGNTCFRVSSQQPGYRSVLFIVMNVPVSDTASAPVYRSPGPSVRLRAGRCRRNSSRSRLPALCRRRAGAPFMCKCADCDTVVSGATGVPACGRSSMSQD